MARKTIKIAFERGGIVPASVLKDKTDVRVAPHEPIPVPIEYGAQLITDRHAYDYEARKAEEKAAADAEKRRAASAKQDAELGDRIQELKAALKAEQDKSAGLEQELAELQARFDATTSEPAGASILPGEEPKSA